jgi:hypothetical protein
MVARQVLPGSADFKIGCFRPSRTYSAARVDGATGAAGPTLAMSCVRVGNGSYDCTVNTTLAPVNFAVTLSLRDDDRTATVTYTGPATFHVNVRDLLGIATDCDFSAVVTGIEDGTGNEGFEPLDAFLQIVIVQG